MKITKITKITFISLIAIALVVLIIVFFYFRKFELYTIIPTVLTLVVVITTLLIASDIYKLESNKIIALNKIDREREIIIERITKVDDKKPKNKVTDTILLSLNRTQEYYTVNLSQAKSSYGWGISAVVFGFLIIIFCIWYVLQGNEANSAMVIISGISGVILEFIGGTFFYFYRKSISQLNLYFNVLMKIQDTMLAIELCDKISDDKAEYTKSINGIINVLMVRSSNTDTLK